MEICFEEVLYDSLMTNTGLEVKTHLTAEQYSEDPSRMKYPLSVHVAEHSPGDVTWGMHLQHPPVQNIPYSTWR